MGKDSCNERIGEVGFYYLGLGCLGGWSEVGIVGWVWGGKSWLGTVLKIATEDGAWFTWNYQGR